MGKMQITLIGVRVAGIPTFIPGNDVNGHHTMLTVINNRGKNKKTGVEQSDEVTLNVWGKYAQTAALFLDVGREIHVIGELRSFTKDTGILKGTTGKTELHRRNEVLVDRFFFGADSFKSLSGRVNTNLQALKDAGKLDPNTTITAEDLLKVSRGPSYDYNPAAAALTGMYGCAKVYISKNGFIVPGQTVVPAVNASPAPAAAEIARLTAEVERMKAEATGTAVATTGDAVAEEVTDVTDGAEKAKVVNSEGDGGDGDPVDPFNQ